MIERYNQNDIDKLAHILKNNGVISVQQTQFMVFVLKYIQK